MSLARVDAINNPGPHSITTMITLLFRKAVAFPPLFACDCRRSSDFRAFLASCASVLCRWGDRALARVHSFFLVAIVILVLSAGPGHGAPPSKVVYLEDPNTKDSEVSRLVPAADTRKVWAERLRIGHLAAEHLGRCPRLEEIDLRSTDVCDKDMLVLSRLPRLKVLDLCNTSVSDAGLRVLGGCVTLKELYVLGTHATGRGVAEILARRPGLYVSSSTVSSEAARRAIVELERMKVDALCPDWSKDPLGAVISKPDPSCIVDFRDDWDGDSRKANDLLKVVTADEPGVSLHLGGLKRPSLEMLRGLRQVGFLTIPASGLVDKDLSVLRTIGRVENLDLKSAGFTDEALQYVADVPSLETLYINGFSDAAIDQLAKLPRLTKLGICGPTFSEEALEHCAKLPHLKTLAVVDCARISHVAKVRFFMKHRQIHWSSLE